jgi:hypothetical protein
MHPSDTQCRRCKDVFEVVEAVVTLEWGPLAGEALCEDCADSFIFKPGARRNEGR